MDKLRIIKTIVFVITFLLVFSCMLLLGTLYKKVNRPVNIPEGAINLNEPQGSTITQMQVHNGNLYLLVKDGGLPDRVIIFNQDTNQPIKMNIN